MTLCHVNETGGNGIATTSSDSTIYGNHLANGASNDFTNAITFGNDATQILCNTISIDGASVGILAADFNFLVVGNSILGGGGTGTGIDLGGTNNSLSSKLHSNLVEGFSGSGGKGYDLRSIVRPLLIYLNNAAYNNATNYANEGDSLISNDNESLGADPFDKSGSDTFANRFTYFAPVDTGNVHGGAYPSGARRDKGAVQHVDPAGGAASILGGGNLQGGFA